MNSCLHARPASILPSPLSCHPHHHHGPKTSDIYTLLSSAMWICCLFYLRHTEIPFLKGPSKHGDLGLLLREETDLRERSSFPQLTVLVVKTQEPKPTLLTNFFLPSHQVPHSPSTFPCFLVSFPKLVWLLSHGDVFCCQAGHWGRLNPGWPKHMISSLGRNPAPHHTWGPAAHTPCQSLWQRHHFCMAYTYPSSEKELGFQTQYL